MSQITLNPKYQYVANQLVSNHYARNKERDAMTRAYAQLIAEGLQLAEEYDNNNKDLQ